MQKKSVHDRYYPIYYESERRPILFTYYVSKRLIFYRLMNAAPEYVYRWFEKRDNVRKRESNNSRFNESNLITIEESHLGFLDTSSIERALLRRNNRTINLALAQYGDSTKILCHLFSTNVKAIRAACLSNEHVRELLFKFGERIINESSEDELYILYANQFLSDERSFFNPTSFLKNLYQRRGLFENISHDLWQNHIWHSIKSNVIVKFGALLEIEGDEAVWREPYSELRDSIWNLLEIVPADEQWASTLGALLSGIPARYPNNYDVPRLLERWAIPRRSESSWYHVGLEIARLIPDYGEDFHKLLNSNDLALRRSYYRRFFCQTTFEIEQIFKREGSDYVIWDLILNENIMRNKEFINQVKACCNGWDWDGYFDDRINKIDQLSVLTPEVEIRNRIKKIDKFIKKIPAQHVQIEQLIEKVEMLSAGLRATVWLGVIGIIVYLAYRLF